MSLGQLLMWLMATIALGFVCMLMYKPGFQARNFLSLKCFSSLREKLREKYCNSLRRYLKKEMRTTLREEVMLEVQAQMGEYAQLRGA